MQLNAEDGGHRQCILVTNNENGICENVTYERNKRVIEGYKTPKGIIVDGLKNNNLRYYKTKLTERGGSRFAKRNLFNNLKDLLRIKEDAYTEQKQFGNMKVLHQFFNYYKTKDRQLIIVYRPEYVIKNLVEEIKKMDCNNPIKIYVFVEDGYYAFEQEFTEVKAKVELIALPDAYNKALRYILPEKNEEPEESGDSINLEDFNEDDVIDD